MSNAARAAQDLLNCGLIILAIGGTHRWMWESIQNNAGEEGARPHGACEIVSSRLSY